MATQLSLGLAPARVRLDAACRDMALLRAVEDAMHELALTAALGPVPSWKGTEAVLSGIAAAAHDRDWILPGPRQASVALLRGASLHAWFGQVLGRTSDPSRGRQSPGLVSFRSLNVVSPSVPPGSQLPIAAGVGRAMRMAGRAEVAIAACGHAAVASADFHVGLNFAATARAPVVFVVTTQGDLRSATAARTVAVKASGYGVPSTEVDGGDALAAENAIRSAVEAARAGKGPHLIDARCPAPDAALAPTGPRLATPATPPWASADPLARGERALAEAGGSAAEDATQRRAGIRERVDDAIAAVLDLPAVDSSLLLDDVFARPTPALLQQRLEWIADRAFREFEED